MEKVNLTLFTICRHFFAGSGALKSETYFSKSAYKKYVFLWMKKGINWNSKEGQLENKKERKQLYNKFTFCLRIIQKKEYNKNRIT